MKIRSLLSLTIVLSLLATEPLTAGHHKKGEKKEGDSALPANLGKGQENWYKKYKKQANVPQVDEMLMNTDKEPALTDGFVSLYNGKDLNDWVSYGGKCKFEPATEDTIIGTCVKGSPSTYLSTKKEYADFIFTCDIKWEVEGNTGVQFRSKVKDGKKGSKSVYGPQFEMEGLSKGRGWSGGIYGQSCGGYFYPLWHKDHEKVRNGLVEGWNRVTIYAKGDTVKTWLNGIPASHWKTEEYTKGFFSLQVHSGKQGTIHFKNIRVKELN